MPETSVSRTPVYSARPSVRVDGQTDERIDTQLLALTLDEQDGGLGALELRLSNWVATSSPAGGAELAFGASSRLKLGCELSVSAGDTAAPQPLFTGRVSALEIVCVDGQAPELVVLAEDGLGAARRARRSQAYVAMSPADVVRQVASHLGLNASVSGLDAPTATWVQLDETDLAFLRRLVGRLDGELQIIDGRLVAGPLTDTRPGVIELALYSQLQRVRICADLSEQVTAVSVAGWSARDGAAVQGNASSLDQPGPGSGRSGPDWARQALGERPTHLAAPAVCSSDEARAVASAAYDQRARRFVRAEGQAVGNPALRVGCQLRLTGISPQFDNTYRVLRTTHRYDQQLGYRTEFSAECAFLG